ncbi:MAG: vanadium-dependent haloperoxidase [Candidatus Methylomirabilaceae bacterium]
MTRVSWMVSAAIFGLMTGAAGQIALDRVAPALRDNAVVVAWSRRGAELAAADTAAPPFKGLRALALMHLAMHDGLNAVVPAYRGYTDAAADSLANPVAAAAQAAHDVLSAIYTARSRDLAAALAEDLGRVPDGAAKTRGVALGRSVAAALLAARRGDGWDEPGSYAYRSAPGAYQTTPNWQGFVLQPGFRTARPLALQHPEQFRPPPPPALTSVAYATAVAEVLTMGAATSVARTHDQTSYAVWWMEFAETSVNRLARELLTERRTHAWAAARLFALLNMSLYDGYIATWDAKYEFNHWRPYTAIRSAATDANPATAPDTVWESLRPAPPFPEYTSAHAAGCSAAFEVLAETFGDTVSFRLSTTSAPPEMPGRRFASFRAAAGECADSRVRLGWHFRYATDAGLTLGRAVARYVAERYLRALK